MSVRRKNDVLWKGMLEEVFDDVLRFIFKDADQLFNFKKRFEFLDKELNELYPEPDKQSSTRVVDKLVKVFRSNGEEEWMLLHVEVQEQNGLTFPERMFRYYYRLYDKYQKPVTAIAIFTGNGRKSFPDRYKHSCLGTHLEYIYNTLRIVDYPDQMLETSKNPFALVMLAVKKALLPDGTPDMERLKHKLLVAKTLLARKDLSRRKIKAILSFLNNYVVFKNKETNSIFTKEIHRITSKTKPMGFFEHWNAYLTEEALEKANRRFVRNLLKQSNFSMAKIASIAGVPLDFVKKVKRSIRTK